MRMCRLSRELTSSPLPLIEAGFVFLEAIVANAWIDFSATRIKTLKTFICWQINVPLRYSKVDISAGSISSDKFHITKLVLTTADYKKHLALFSL